MPVLRTYTDTPTSLADVDNSPNRLHWYAAMENECEKHTRMGVYTVVEKELVWTQALDADGEQGQVTNIDKGMLAFISQADAESGQERKTKRPR